MPRNASGVYTLPASNPVVPLTVITSQWANTTMSDVANALTNSIAANGVTNPTANLPMAGFVHTGVGPATQYNHYARADQVQQAFFAKATGVTANAGQTQYSCSLPFGSGSIIPLVHQQPMTLTPNIVNLGPASISINGGPFSPIVNPDNSPIAAGRLLANTPIAMLWNSFTSSWTLIGYYSAVVNSLTSADPAMITASPSTGATVLTPIVNTANGMVKLGADGKVPSGLLPVGGAILLGTWNAAPGTLPPNGTISGQYYIIGAAGTLTLYKASGATWVASPQACLSGDEILWQQVAGQPTGWYYIQKSTAATATQITNTATPAFPAATNLQQWINAADSATGFVLANSSRVMSGTQRMGIVSSDNIGGNINYNGGWIFYQATNMAWFSTIAVNPPYAKIDFVSSAASTGVGSPISFVDLCYWGVTASFVRSPWGVGNTPRSPGGQQFHFDVYGTGSQRFMVQSTDAQVGMKFVSAASGVFIDNLRVDAAGNNLTIAGVNTSFRFMDTAGTLSNGMVIKPNHSIQFGDNAQAVPGALYSTYKYYGGVSGPLDFNQVQTAGVSVGANVTSITMNQGQIARILVIGNGGITLPAAVKIPRGGATYGLFATIIGLFFDGGTVLATFTPYDA